MNVYDQQKPITVGLVLKCTAFLILISPFLVARKIYRTCLSEEERQRQDRQRFFDQLDAERRRRAEWQASQF